MSVQRNQRLDPCPFCRLFHKKRHNGLVAESGAHPRVVVIVAFDGVTLLDVAGAGEVFIEANRFGADYQLKIASVDGRDVTSSIGTRLGVSDSIASVTAADTVMVAGSDDLPRRPIAPELVSAITSLAGRTRRLASICTGSFVLAQAGLLEGRRATTHWHAVRSFARAFPDITVEPDALFVRDGNVYTSAGISSGIDLALALVEMDYGVELVRSVARWLVVYLKRAGGQSQFSVLVESAVPPQSPLRKVTDGPLGARLLKLLDNKGMTGLAYWDNGFKQMSANKKLLAPSDYKGLKFRIQSSKVLEAQFRSLGAIPQVMAFSDVYQALQTGVVDGQENTWSNIYTQKMHEVQKYATVTNHGYIGYVVVVNKKFWDGMPPDIRAACEKAMKEATEFGNSQSAKENDDALEAIKKSGKTEIVTLTPDQDEAMRKAMMPVYKDVASRVGQPLIDEFLKETGRSPIN